MGRIYELSIAIAAKLAPTFNAQMRTAGAGVAGLGASVAKLKAVEASTEKFARLTDAVTQAQRRYNLAADALDRMTAAEKAAGGATRESAKWTAAGTRAVRTADAALMGARNAALKEGEALHLAGVDTSRLTQEQERLAGALKRTSALSKLGNIGKKIGAELKTALFWTAGAATAATTAAFAAVASTAEKGAGIHKAAARLGVGGEDLQVVRAVLRQTGVEAEDTDAALAKMNITLGKSLTAKKGGSAFAGNVGELQILGGGGTKVAANNPYKALHLDGAKFVKLPIEEKLIALSAATGHLKTQAERAAAATAVLGKSAGTQFLPLLTKGPAEIRNAFAAAHKSANILSDRTVENSHKFELSFNATKAAIAGVKDIFGGALMPVAERVLKKITKLIDENRGQIKIWADKIAAWIEGRALPAVEKMIPSILSLGKGVATLIGKAADAAGGFDRLALGALAFKAVGVPAIGAATRALVEYGVKAKLAKSSSDGIGAGITAGAPGAGKAMGLAANAAMLAGAATVGAAIGATAASYLDDAFHISDKLDQATKLGEQSATYGAAFKTGGLISVIGKYNADSDKKEAADAAAFLAANHPRAAALALTAQKNRLLSMPLPSEGRNRALVDAELSGAGAPNLTDLNRSTSLLTSGIARGAGNQREATVIHIGSINLDAAGGDVSDPATVKKLGQQLGEHLGPHIDNHLERRDAKKRRGSYE